MKQRFLLLGLLACVLAAGLACDSASPVAPSGTVLSVNANPSQIGLSSGASTITVTGFKPDGNPLNPGTQLLVSTDLGDLYDAATGGTLVSSLEIGSGGRAIAYLRSDGRGGTATVTATLTTGGEASATASVQIGETAESQPTLVISANPTTIAIERTSRISLLGRNSDNTPVSAGQRIRLTADFGKVVEDGGDLNSSAIDSVVTDANGEAFATFVAGDRGGTGVVRAILGTSEEVSVDININDVIDSLQLLSDTTNVRRLECTAMGGGEVIGFTAIVQDAQGRPLVGTTVTFDPGRGTFNNAVVASNNQGQALATLTVCSDQLQSDPNGFEFTVTASATSEGRTERDTVTMTVLGDP